MIWCSAALAAELALGGLGTAAGEGVSPSAGAWLSGGMPVHERVLIEGELAGGLRTDGLPHLRAQPQARVFLGDRRLASLSAVAGAGVVSDDGWAPILDGGVAVEVPVGPGHVRLQAVVGTHFGVRPARSWISAGWVLGRASEPAVESVPEPVPEPEPAPVIAQGLSVDPPTATVWVPHPVCQWVPVNQVDQVLADLPEGTEVHVHAPGYLPEESFWGAEDVVRLAKAAPQGGLLVAARPADLVLVNETRIPLAEDGVAVVNLAEGPVRVEVRGGGREVIEEVAVAESHATWVRVDPPETLRVTFPVGLADLSAEWRTMLEERAQLAGRYVFRVYGSASPEGNATDNRELADSRADVVADVLEAAGARVERVGSRPPDPGLSLAEQRAAVVVPLEAE